MYGRNILCWPWAWYSLERRRCRRDVCVCVDTAPQVFGDWWTKTRTLIYISMCILCVLKSHRWWPANVPSRDGLSYPYWSKGLISDHWLSTGFWSLSDRTYFIFGVHACEVGNIYLSHHHTTKTTLVFNSYTSQLNWNTHRSLSDMHTHNIHVYIYIIYMCVYKDILASFSLISVHKSNLYVDRYTIQPVYTYF